MTLYSLIKNIEALAQAQPNISFVGTGDIYELNKTPDISYPAVVISQTSHNKSSLNEYETYGLNIFAVDRLTSASENRLDIQSWADMLLKTLITLIEENNLGIIIDDVVIYPFTERFESLCAGAYATIRIRIDNIDCPGDLYLVELLNKLKFIEQYERDLIEITDKTKQILGPNVCE